MRSDRTSKETPLWAVPANEDAAQRRRNHATEELFSVDLALSQLPSGSHRTPKRTGLMQQKAELVTEIRKLKTWFRENDKKARENPDELLLKAAYKLITELEKDGVELDPHELEVVEALKSRLKVATKEKV